MKHLDLLNHGFVPVCVCVCAGKTVDLSGANASSYSTPQRLARKTTAVFDKGQSLLHATSNTEITEVLFVLGHLKEQEELGPESTRSQC